jgi:hypothetical protein
MFRKSIVALRSSWNDLLGRFGWNGIIGFSEEYARR